MQIRVTEGTINLRVLRLEDQESIEADTPNLAFTVLRPGRFRINVNEAGEHHCDQYSEGTAKSLAAAPLTPSSGRAGLFHRHRFAQRRRERRWRQR